MQGVSRDSLAQAQTRLDQVVAEPQAAPAVLADELFSVLALLDREISLRRVLTDPAASGERKAALVHGLLDGKVSARAVDLVAELASAHWSRPRDIADAVEILAVRSAVVAAERDASIDDVEDALFRFGRVVAAEPRLHAVLADRTVPAERKVDLVRSLLDGKVGSVTSTLIEQAVAAPRGRTIEKTLEEYAELVAAHRSRLVAVVRVAASLTDEQQARLSATLERVYGQAVNLHVFLDPTIEGGISVEVGDEVIDGTISTRLDEARKRLAS